MRVDPLRQGLALLAAPASPAKGEEMSLMAFNVGKADCLLLRAGEQAYLIDTARGKNWESIEESLNALQIGHLDGVIITHMDSDHVGGLKKMLKSGIETDRIYAPAWYLPEKDEDKENPAVKQTAKHSTELVLLKGGDELPLRAAGGDHLHRSVQRVHGSILL